MVFLTFSGFSYSDNHETQKEEVLNKVEEIAKEIEDEDEVPLNDPFAGNEGNNSMSSNIPEDEQDNELSLYNFKLVGLISGKDYSYISLVNTAGEVMTITLGQYLGKIQLVDLRLNEAIFKKEDKSFIIIDFNNQIREANEY
jgi:Tfp pilus assembly protein PilP